MVMPVEMNREGSRAAREGRKERGGRGKIYTGAAFSLEAWTILPPPSPLDLGVWLHPL